MKLWRVILLIFFIIFSFYTNKPVFAQGLHLRDTLSNTQPGVVSNHEIIWGIDDAGGIQEGEGFDIVFDSAFNTASIASGDVDISDDGGDLTLANDCSGGEQVSFVNNNNDTFTFTICTGDGGAINTGSQVVIKIGTNAAGGTHQITNPSSAGGYIVYIDGNGGYEDADDLQVVILGSVSVSATVPPQAGDLRFIGYASPSALVFFIESGSVIGTQLANASSIFDKTLVGLSEGIHSISMYATDVGAVSTLTVTITINVIAGTTTTVSGIILPPTFSVDAGQVKRPASLTGQGYAINNKPVRIFISGSGNSLSLDSTTDGSGHWSVNLNPKLHLGYKYSFAMALDGIGGQSALSQERIYEVLLSADLNVDTLVNLTDFSILMYSYAQSPVPNVLADINDDGPVDLVDFSIMMYYWTGG